MSTTGREWRVDQGFPRSDLKTFTIANGADGSAVDPVDLERNYAFIVVRCTDAQYIAASTTLGAEVGYADADAMTDLWKQDGEAIWASGTLPETGTFAFTIIPAFGAQRLRLKLSNNASGGAVVFEVYGFDAVKQS